MKRRGRWIKKVTPEHNCCTEWPLPFRNDGICAGSIWECSCGEQYLVVEKTATTTQWRKL